MKLQSLCYFFLMGFASLSWSQSEGEVGRDVTDVFARALRGEPLRYVAIGGSITQGGGGWIGDWLKAQFPKSEVTAINSGISATGSSLGVFRAERDIIAHQPDLVAIEFCVNDGGQSDEDAIQNMETLVVRLKSLPKPPAIIIYEAAAESGVNLKRHRKIAEHYGLLEVDLQKAVDAYLKANGLPWKTFFTDDVHPNAAGHEFYTKTIAAALEPEIEAARDLDAPLPPKPLPPLLSDRPLLLDARMIPLTEAPGWTFVATLPQWWNRFFQGVIRADQPGTTLELPFRGTTVGLFYTMDKTNGGFVASVDGKQPRSISTNFRDGFDYAILGKNLEPQAHVLQVALPPKSTDVTSFSQNGPIQLGFLLVAGETKASSEKARQGPFGPEALARLTFSAVPAGSWKIAGPYPVPDNLEHSARSEMATLFPPEKADAEVKWLAVPPQESAWVDLTKVEPGPLPAVVYATTVIPQDQEETVLLGVSADYYVQVWLNGVLIADLGNRGNPRAPVLVPVTLQRGENHIRIKVGSGSKGFGFSLSVGRMR